VALGLALRGVASAAIDVSDGLAGDLGHLLKASGLGATVDWKAVPRSPRSGDVMPRCSALCLSGGNDYELLFAAPPSAVHAVEAAGAEAA